MKRLFLFPALLLFGCGDMTRSVDDAQKVNAPEYSQRVLRISTIVCADGNQVRMAVFGFGSSGTAFSGWTVLNEDGTPKRCVKRPKSVQPQYEEVPQ